MQSRHIVYKFMQGWIRTLEFPSVYSIVFCPPCIFNNRIDGGKTVDILSYNFISNPLKSLDFLAYQEINLIYIKLMFIMLSEEAICL